MAVGDNIFSNMGNTTFGQTPSIETGTTPFMGGAGGNELSLAGIFGGGAQGGGGYGAGDLFGSQSGGFAGGFGPNTQNTAGGISDILAQFGKDGKFQGTGALLGGAGDLFSAWNGYKQTKLAEKQFDMASKYAALNASNNAIVTNEALSSRRGARRAVAGGNAGKGPQVAATV